MNIKNSGTLCSVLILSITLKAASNELTVGLEVSKFVFVSAGKNTELFHVTMKVNR